MDIIWDSTLNIFEWTVLQELMANWLAVEVGSYSSILRVYCTFDENFYERANDILARPFYE